MAQNMNIWVLSDDHKDLATLLYQYWILLQNSHQLLTGSN